MLDKLIRRLAPVAMIALAAGISGCDGMEVNIGGAEGVPLAQLDKSGPAPTELVLAGPDTVLLTEGDALDIDVSGDAKAVEALRFSLKDGALGISREKNSWSEKGVAVVKVTMPAPRELVMAGSGRIESSSVASNAEVTSAGSGTIKVTGINAEKLEVTIAGSGSFEGEGVTKTLDLTIAGSGSANMPALKTDKAELSIAGSGSSAFASDGMVEASVIGSGDVTVTGNATCTVSAIGSGKVTCKTVQQEPEGAE